MIELVVLAVAGMIASTIAYSIKKDTERYIKTNDEYLKHEKWLLEMKQRHALKELAAADRMLRDGEWSKEWAEDKDESDY